VAAAVGGGFSPSATVGRFVVTAVGGVAAGLVVAGVVRVIRRWRQDPLSLNAVSLATPFAAYLLGEYAHVSGVLAVVVAGLVLGHSGPRALSGASRLQVNAVWRLVDFLLEGLVFLLIGQQLPTVLGGLRQYDASTVVVAAAVTLGGVLLVRPLWLLLTQSLPRSLHTWLGGEGDEDDEDPPTGLRTRLTDRLSDRLTGREVVALSWAGTRGVISLAAIFTLPRFTDSGAAFPGRDLLLFCAFLAVLVTLVGQGLTFGPLARALKLRANVADQARVRNHARSAAVKAALSRLKEMQAAQHDEADDRAIAAIRAQLEARLDRHRRRMEVLANASSGEIPFSPQYEAALRVRRAVIDAEREELLRWRDAGRLPDAELRVLERELDHEEGLLPSRTG
jgi:NhaP-type Na+/H+ or K+/H+ antiporter